MLFLKKESLQLSLKSVNNLGVTNNTRQTERPVHRELPWAQHLDN